MAKRYHSSHRRADHARDMHNDERHTGRDGGLIGNFKHSDHYAGMESRRRMEMEDAGMIHEDHRAIANLPQEVMIKPYPKTGPYMPEGLDDTIRGVDQQMRFDGSQRAKHFYPKKV
jgi:hypothetical protein